MAISSTYSNIKTCAKLVFPAELVYYTVRCCSYSAFDHVYISVLAVLPATLSAGRRERGLLEREDSSQQGGALRGSVTCHTVCVCQHAHRPEDERMTVFVCICIVCAWSFFLRGSIWQCAGCVVFLFKKSERWTVWFLLREIQEHATQCIHTEITGNPMTSLCLLVLTEVNWGIIKATRVLNLTAVPSNFN